MLRLRGEEEEGKKDSRRAEREEKGKGGEVDSDVVADPEGLRGHAP